VAPARSRSTLCIKTLSMRVTNVGGQEFVYGYDIVTDPVARYLGKIIFPTIKRQIASGLVFEYLFDVGSVSKFSIHNYLKERGFEMRMRNLETLLNALGPEHKRILRPVRNMKLNQVEWRFHRDFRNFSEDLFERIKRLKRQGVL